MDLVHFSAQPNSFKFLFLFYFEGSNNRTYFYIDTTYYLFIIIILLYLCCFIIIIILTTVYLHCIQTHQMTFHRFLLLQSATPLPRSFLDRHSRHLMSPSCRLGRLPWVAIQVACCRPLLLRFLLLPGRVARHLIPVRSPAEPSLLASYRHHG